MRELVETHFAEMSELERKKQMSMVMEKLNPADSEDDQMTAVEQRHDDASGEWILSDDTFLDWSDTARDGNPQLYLHGAPGAGTYCLPNLSIFFSGMLCFWLDHLLNGTRLRYSQVTQHKNNALINSLFSVWNAF
jgi:hypothetical protein